MKFSFLVLVFSNAILATSAFDNGYEYTFSGQELKELYDNATPVTPVWSSNFEFGSMSFEEAQKKIEIVAAHQYRLYRDLGDDTNFLNSKYKELLLQVMAKENHKDDRGFLVILSLYQKSQRKLIMEAEEAIRSNPRDSLDLLQQHKADDDNMELFLAFAAQQTRFRVEILLAHNLDNSNMDISLVDLHRAASFGHDWLIKILLNDKRTIKCFQKNIKPGSNLADLVGPHILEYAEKELKIWGKDQETANGLLISAMGSPATYVYFLARLDKADGATHQKALSIATGKGLSGKKDSFLATLLLAYGKLEFDFQMLNPETEQNPSLKALYKADPRVQKAMARTKTQRM